MMQVNLDSIFRMELDQWGGKEANKDLLGAAYHSNAERLVLSEESSIPALFQCLTNLRKLVLIQIEDASCVEKVNVAVALRTLRMTNCKLPRVVYLPSLTALRKVKFFRCSLQNFEIEGGFPHLRKLSITTCSLESCKGLDKLTALEALDLSDNSLARLDFALPLSLTKLVVSANRLICCNGLSSLTGLVTLEANQNELSTCSSLRALVNLKKLSLEHNVGITSLEPLASLTSLTKIKLGGQRITGLNLLTSLNTLYLDHVVVEPLSMLSSLTALKLLWVVDPTSREAQRIKELGLTHFKITRTIFPWMADSDSE